MERIARSCEDTRRFSVLRLLLGAALGAFGSLLLGAFGMATSAWASEDSAEAQGLAALTDPFAAEVSDMSRLAARLVPQNQRGHRMPAAGDEDTRLVSGLTEPVGTLMDKTDRTVRAVLREDARPGLLDLDDEPVGDSAAEVVTPLVGSVMKGMASVAERPASVVFGVYETVAPSTAQVDVLARLVNDGLSLGDGTTPGSVLAGAAGQPLTTLPATADSHEVAAALPGVHHGRPAAAVECSAADLGEREADRSDSEVAHGLPRIAAEPWPFDGRGLPDLKIIPGGAVGSTVGNTVDSAHTAVCVFPSTAGEEVSLSRTVFGELGRPLDRAAELSVAPD